MTNARAIISFAVGYQGYHQAIQEGNENGQIVYQDMLVDAADKLGLQDSDMEALGQHRDEKKRRDEEFMAKYREAL